MEEQVILVDEQDNPIGLMPKLEAHQKRFFTVHFLCLSLTKRRIDASATCQTQVSFPRLWTNTCCSHQRDGETNIQAGKRRLQEEMGFSTELKEVTKFIYKAPFDNGLTEHEFDHVLLGHYEDDPIINIDEVSSWKWMPIEDV